MRNILIAKYFGATRFKSGDQRGQTALEYILVLMVVLGVVFALARPLMNELSKKVQGSFKTGFLAEDPSGGGFYYFPLK